MVHKPPEPPEFEHQPDTLVEPREVSSFELTATASDQPPPRLRVSWTQPDGEERVAQFSGAFCIGRSVSCEVQLLDPYVSKRQAEVYPAGGQWIVRDLDSLHGTYLNGVRVSEAPLAERATLRLRKDGPAVELEQIAAADPFAQPPRSVTDVIRHYFNPTPGQAPGEHTLMIRQAFQLMRRAQSRRYWIALAGAALMLLAAVALIVHQRGTLDRAVRAHIDLFYDISDFRLAIAELERAVAATADPVLVAEVQTKRQRLVEMEQRYNAFLDEIGLLSGRLSAEDRLIYHVVRIFGECELNMPPSFVDEVKRYIRRWQEPPSLSAVIRRLDPAVHVPLIGRALSENHLPPQFLYLGAQESGFDPRAVGPRTRFGIAKGVWQFIPTTAQDYGLRVGPLVGLPEYDPADQRFDFERATQAAARYLRDLYETEAQASGLLVLAAYNWGPGNVRRLIRQLPGTPRERNFWKLLQRFDIPRQTYDYVLAVVAAAVIGEDPARFGFDFENPLRALQAARAPAEADASLEDAKASAAPAVDPW